jgi:hypothetical protein
MVNESPADLNARIITSSETDSLEEVTLQRRDVPLAI